MVNERGRDALQDGQGPVTIFGPDFPFAFDDWIAHPAGLGSIPAERHGEEVAVVGAGISGLVAAYELMKLGVRPVVYEASQLGGRLRSQAFEGADGIVAAADSQQDDGHWQEAFLWARGFTISAGSNEIMRNLIAENGLRLPREPRRDKTEARL